MLKFPCLVLDHDDTVVQSEATVNYPCFCETMKHIRPNVHVTLEDYARGCSELNFAEMCRQWYGFTEQELLDEFLFWKEYSKAHRPVPFPGIDRIIHKQKEAGGMVFAVSHSGEETITRDYRTNFDILPDGIYGWELPEEKRKPSPYPLLDIMEKYNFRPEQILVVDDMKPAYDMAKAAGVQIAFAGWGRKDFENIYSQMKSLCNYTFDSVAELDAFLF